MINLTAIVPLYNLRKVLTVTTSSSINSLNEDLRSFSYNPKNFRSLDICNKNHF